MIKGEIIELRAVEVSDLNYFYTWINDEESNKWRGIYNPMNLEQATEYLQELNQKNTVALFICYLKEPVGIIGLKGICSRSRRAELWLQIGNIKMQNRGIGTDAIKTLCRYGFEQMNLHRIWLEFDAEHEAAQSCYAKCGFKHEGILRDGYYRHGKYRNTAIMSRLSTD